MWQKYRLGRKRVARGQRRNGAARRRTHGHLEPLEVRLALAANAFVQDQTGAGEVENGWVVFALDTAGDDLYLRETTEADVFGHEAFLRYAGNSSFLNPDRIPMGAGTVPNGSLRQRDIYVTNGVSNGWRDAGGAAGVEITDGVTGIATGANFRVFLPDAGELHRSDVSRQSNPISTDPGRNFAALPGLRAIGNQIDLDPETGLLVRLGRNNQIIAPLGGNAAIGTTLLVDSGQHVVPGTLFGELNVQVAGADYTVYFTTQYLYAHEDGSDDGRVDLVFSQTVDEDYEVDLDVLDPATGANDWDIAGNINYATGEIRLEIKAPTTNDFILANVELQAIYASPVIPTAASSVRIMPGQDFNSGFQVDLPGTDSTVRISSPIVNGNLVDLRATNVFIDAEVSVANEPGFIVAGSERTPSSAGETVTVAGSSDTARYTVTTAETPLIVGSLSGEISLAGFDLGQPEQTSRTIVRVATAAEIDGVYDDQLGTITFTATGQAAVDGADLNAGDLILVQHGVATEAGPANRRPSNGVYRVTTAGDAITPAVLTRLLDANNDPLFDATVLVVEGDTQSTNETGSIYNLSEVVPVTAEASDKIVARLATADDQGVTNASGYDTAIAQDISISPQDTTRVVVRAAELNAVPGRFGTNVAPQDTDRYVVRAAGALSGAFDANGETITANANEALVIDGVAVAVGDLVLVKDQADDAENGIYEVTAAGAADPGGARWVLAREVAREFEAVVYEGSNATTNVWAINNSAKIFSSDVDGLITELVATTTDAVVARVATAATLAGAYNNTAGTITAAAAAALSIDGVVLAVDDVVIVKDGVTGDAGVTSQANGVYRVTQAGAVDDPATPGVDESELWVLTRLTSVPTGGANPLLDTVAYIYEGTNATTTAADLEGSRFQVRSWIRATAMQPLVAGGVSVEVDDLVLIGGGATGAAGASSIANGIYRVVQKGAADTQFWELERVDKTVGRQVVVHQGTNATNGRQGSVDAFNDGFLLTDGVNGRVQVGRAGLTAADAVVVRAATNAPLAASYDPLTGQITANAVEQIPQIDGIQVNADDYVLVRHSAGGGDTAEHGVYRVVSVGGAEKWVLERWAPDGNTQFETTAYVYDGNLASSSAVNLTGGDEYTISVVGAAVPQIDGEAVAAGDIVLIRQGIDGTTPLGAADAANGLYAVDTLGTPESPWVFRRIMNDEGDPLALPVLTYEGNTVGSQQFNVTYDEAAGVTVAAAGPPAANDVLVRFAFSAAAVGGDYDVTTREITNIGAWIADSGVQANDLVLIGTPNGAAADEAAANGIYQYDGVNQILVPHTPRTDATAYVYEGPGATSSALVPVGNRYDVGLPLRVVTTTDTTERVVRAATSGALVANLVQGNRLRGDTVPLVVGGVAMQRDDYVLVKDRVSSLDGSFGGSTTLANGVYRVISSGSNSLPWILERDGRGEGIVTAANTAEQYELTVGTLQPIQTFTASEAGELTFQTTATTPSGQPEAAAAVLATGGNVVFENGELMLDWSWFPGTFAVEMDYRFGQQATAVEQLVVSAAVRAPQFDIRVTDDVNSSFRNRGVVRVTETGSLAGAGGANASALYLEAVDSDVFVGGAIRADIQSYLFVTSTGEAPFTFTTRSATNSSIGSINGDVVDVTLTNSQNVALDDVLTHTINLDTTIDSLRIAATQDDAIFVDADQPLADAPYRFAATVRETDNLDIEGSLASGAPISVTVGNNLDLRAAVRSHGDVTIVAGGEFQGNSAISTTNGTISLIAPVVTMNGLLQVLDTPVDDTVIDVLVRATSGNLVLARGVSAVNRIDLEQAGTGGIISNELIVAREVNLDTDGDLDVETSADVVRATALGTAQGVGNVRIEEIGAAEFFVDAKGFVGLVAGGTDVGVGENRRAALTAELRTATELFVSAPRGSIDVYAITDNELIVGDAAALIIGRAETMLAAGDVKIRSSQGPITVLDAPFAGSGTLKARAATDIIEDNPATEAVVESNNIDGVYDPGRTGVTSATLTAEPANNLYPGRFPVDPFSGIEEFRFRDLVLLTDQDDPAENGLYQITQLGTLSSPWVLTRYSGANSIAEFGVNTYVTVMDGAFRGTTFEVASYANSLDITPLRVTAGTQRTTAEIAVSLATDAPLEGTFVEGDYDLDPVDPNDAITPATITGLPANLEVTAAAYDRADADSRVVARLATKEPLAGTYNEEAFTITADAAEVLLVDGEDVQAGDLILVRLGLGAESAQSHPANGVYEVTTVGVADNIETPDNDEGVPWVLTRYDHDANGDRSPPLLKSVLVAEGTLASNQNQREYVVAFDDSADTPQFVVREQPLDPAVRIVSAATVASLPGTYDATVGTITAIAAGVLPAIDGVRLNQNDLVLVRLGADLASGETANGVYRVETLGAAADQNPGVQWVLRRAADVPVNATLYVAQGSLASESTATAYETSLSSTALLVNGLPVVEGQLVLVRQGVAGVATDDPESSAANGIYQVVSAGEEAELWQLRRYVPPAEALPVTEATVVVLEGAYNSARTGQTFTIAYDGLDRGSDITIRPRETVTQIGSFDPRDATQFVVSTNGRTSESAGSLGKMLQLYQDNSAQHLGGEDVSRSLSFATVLQTSGEQGLIQLQQELPLIRRPIVLDGSESARYSAGPYNLPAVEIVIDGSRITSTRTNTFATRDVAVTGLEVVATATPDITFPAEVDRMELTQLTIGGFASPGGAGVVVDGASNVRLSALQLGVDENGEPLSNTTGILVRGSSGLAGPVTLTGNRIAASNEASIRVTGSATNVQIVGSQVGETVGVNTTGILIDSTDVAGAVNVLEVSEDEFPVVTSVRVATVQGVPLAGDFDPVKSTITAVANGGIPQIDGVALEAGNLIFVQWGVGDAGDERASVANGIYQVANVGGDDAKWQLERIGVEGYVTVEQGVVYTGRTLLLSAAVSDVRVATVQGVPLAGDFDPVESTITAVANGGIPQIDGVALEAGNLIFVQWGVGGVGDERASVANGIYQVANVGGANAKWQLERIGVEGYVTVEQGAVHAGRTLLLSAAVSSVRVATVQGVPLAGVFNPVASTITAAENGSIPQIDGVALEAGNLIFVQWGVGDAGDERASVANGIYRVADVGGANAKWQLERIGVEGYVTVEQGEEYASRTLLLSDDAETNEVDSIEVGRPPLVIENGFVIATSERLDATYDGTRSVLTGDVPGPLVIDGIDLNVDDFVLVRQGLEGDASPLANVANGIYQVQTVGREAAGQDAGEAWELVRVDQAAGASVDAFITVIAGNLAGRRFRVVPQQNSIGGDQVPDQLLSTLVNRAALQFSDSQWLAVADDLFIGQTVSGSGIAIGSTIIAVDANQRQVILSERMNGTFTDVTVSFGAPGRNAVSENFNGIELRAGRTRIVNTDITNNVLDGVVLGNRVNKPLFALIGDSEARDSESNAIYGNGRYGIRMQNDITAGMLSPRGSGDGQVVLQGNFIGTLRGQEDGPGNLRENYFHALAGGNDQALNQDLNAAFGLFAIRDINKGVPEAPIYGDRFGNLNSEREAPSTPTLAPTDLVAVAGDSRITLSWTAPPDRQSDADIENYEIERINESNQAVVTRTNTILTTFVISGLQNGMEYRVRIRALNSAGVSEWSDPQVTAIPTAPSTPSDRRPRPGY